MKKSLNLPKVLLTASLISAAVSVIIRIILTLTLLDAKYGVYVSGSVLPTIYHTVLAATVLAIAATGCALAPRRSPEYITKSTSLTVFSACLPAFLLTSDLLLTIYNMVTSDVQASIFDILEVCFAVPAILFFLGLAKNSLKRSAILAVTSFFPTAWCVVCLVRIYFDTTALTTSPNKIIGEVALLAVMLYFLTESRAALGMISHRFYVALASCAPVLLLTSALPNLILANKLSISASDNFIRYAVEAAFAIFIWARLAAYASDNTPRTDEDPQ